MPLITFHGRDFPFVLDGNTIVFHGLDFTALGLVNFEDFPLFAAIRVIGNFSCSHNKLKNFRGLPDDFEVCGNFNCSRNRLLTLEGLPKRLMVRGNFDCSFNKLYTLTNMPVRVSIAGSFYCQNNVRLKNLNGLSSYFQSTRTIRKV